MKINNFLLLSLTTFLIGCGNSNLSHDIVQNNNTERVLSFDRFQKKQLRSINTESLDEARSNGLHYLSNLRKKVGLISLISDSSLDTAAYNHSHYIIVNHIGGHYEREGDAGFTGVTPSDRVEYAGYGSRYVGENVSTGNKSVYDSIDKLFSAIYHRFGFLSFSYGKVGIGKDASSLKSAYTYDLGVAENSDTNPSYIVWPYENQKDTIPVFSGESPNPLSGTGCEISGYPVSIQFNSSKNGEISIENIKLWYDKNSSEITDTKLLTKDTDPNHKFSNTEAALFPMKRLEWGTKYKAKVFYTEDGVSKTKEWHFKTKSLSNPYYKITKNDITLDAKNNQTYYLYIVPQDCRGTIGSVRYFPSQVNVGFYDTHTLVITTHANLGDKTTITIGDRKIVLNISDSDSAIYPDGVQPKSLLSLKKGWNLTGANSNLTLAELEKKIGNDNLLIVQGPSKVYKKENVDNNQDFLNDFTHFEDGNGYWIKLLDDKAFEFTPKTSATKIALSKGWNLINPPKEMSLEKIKVQIGEENLLVIQGPNKVYKKENVDNNQDFLNDFEKFEEPKGYWIKLNSPVELDFSK